MCKYAFNLKIYKLIEGALPQFRLNNCALKMQLCAAKEFKSILGLKLFYRITSCLQTSGKVSQNFEKTLFHQNFGEKS